MPLLQRSGGMPSWGREAGIEIMICRRVLQSGPANLRRTDTRRPTDRPAGRQLGRHPMPIFEERRERREHCMAVDERGAIQ